MPKESYVRWFENIRLKDIPEVGGKTASLGELYACSRRTAVGSPTALRSLPVPIARRSRPPGRSTNCAGFSPISITTM